MLDKVLTNGVVVHPVGRRRQSVGIADGRIAGLYEPGSEPEAREVIDVGGRALIPGLVDVHSHHREPGFEYKEDVVTATKACAAGGVTTSIAMPNVSPPPTTVETLSAMFKTYQGRAYVNFNVNPAPTVAEEIPGMADLGIAAFKIFMVTDTGRDYPHMPGIGVHDHGQLLGIMERCAATGVPLMVHPHDQGLMDYIEQQFWARGERDAQAYAKAYAAYGGVAWDTAIATLLRLQEATGCGLHLLHVQTWRSVEMIRRAKENGQDVSAEINPWALFLGHDWANIERLGSYALSYWVPEEHHQALWDGLRDGTIDMVSTDHAPHTREEKELGWTDGWKAHTGTPSTQFYLSLLLTAVAAGKLTLERVVEACSTIPAERFKLSNKGLIAPGRDADIAIVDLDAKHLISDDEVLSKIGWSPYSGVEVTGVPVETLVGGSTVYRRGEGILGSPLGTLAQRNVG